MTGAEIIAAISLATALIEQVQKWIQSGKERGEWTPEQEAEFDAKLEAFKTKAYWAKK